MEMNQVFVQAINISIKIIYLKIEESTLKREKSRAKNWNFHSKPTYQPTASGVSSRFYIIGHK